MATKVEFDKNIDNICSQINFAVNLMSKVYNIDEQTILDIIISRFGCKGDCCTDETVDVDKVEEKPKKKTTKKAKKEEEKIEEKPKKKSTKKAKKEEEKEKASKEVGICEYVFTKGPRQGYMCEKETEGEKYCDLHLPPEGVILKKHIRTILNREIWYNVHPPTGFVMDNENPIGAIGVANKPGIDNTDRTLTSKGFYTLRESDRAICNRWGFNYREDWESVDPVIEDEKHEEEEVVEKKPQRIVVYTDGACPNNGKKGAIGGVGVWFGENDSRNVSERLPGEKQTNQRAEIYAAIRALQMLEGTPGVVEICTDSMYVINAMTQWIAGWMLKKWKDVENADLFQKLQDLACKRTMVWTHVKGHSGIHGNEMADKLAVNGCKMDMTEDKGKEKADTSKTVTRSESKSKVNISDLKEKLKAINKGAVPAKEETKVRVSSNMTKKGKAQVDVYYYKTEDDSIVVSSTSNDEDMEFLSEHFNGKKFELAAEKMDPTHRVALPDARRKKKGIVKIAKRKAQEEEADDDE